MNTKSVKDVSINKKDKKNSLIKERSIKLFI